MTSVGSAIRCGMVAIGASLGECTLRSLAYGTRCIRPVSKKLARKADRMHALYVIPNQSKIFPLSAAPLPRLTRSCNVARFDVISSSEDVRAAQQFRRCIVEQYPDEARKNFLEGREPHGAATKGICAGASLRFIQEYLRGNVQSENELIAVAKRFEEGFDEQAAGLQWALEKTSKVDRQRALESDGTVREKYMKKFLEEQKAGKAVDFDTFMKNFGNEVDAELFKKTTLYTFETIFSLLGLQLESKLNKNTVELYNEITSFDRDVINTLPQGAYLFISGIQGDSHAICLLKCEFGSYIFDPNYGLLVAREHDLFSDLQALGLVAGEGEKLFKLSLQ